MGQVRVRELVREIAAKRRDRVGSKRPASAQREGCPPTHPHPHTHHLPSSAWPSRPARRSICQPPRQSTVDLRGNERKEWIKPEGWKESRDSVLNFCYAKQQQFGRRNKNSLQFPPFADLAPLGGQPLGSKRRNTSAALDRRRCPRPVLLDPPPRHNAVKKVTQVVLATEGAQRRRRQREG